MKNLTNLLFVTLLFLASCDNGGEVNPTDLDYKQEMREFVIGISEYSKAENTSFVIIPQNGIELVTQGGEENGLPHSAYLNAVDAHGQEDLFYGYNSDNQSTSNNTNSYLRSFLDIAKDNGNVILVTDYCSSQSKMEDSYNQNNANGYTSFAADHRELDNIPNYPNVLNQENSFQTNSLIGVSNFLYLINPENFNTKTDFINAVTSTNYDLLIIDLFFHDGTAFTSTEIEQLRAKANGGARLLICYMSIGEAEDYRYYWKSDWNNNQPEWLDKENPNWAGNFKVKYWNEDWQNIIYGNNDSYLKRVLDAGFDGVYLDIVDAFEFYE